MRPPARPRDRRPGAGGGRRRDACRRCRLGEERAPVTGPIAPRGARGGARDGRPEAQDPGVLSCRPGRTRASVGAGGRSCWPAGLRGGLGNAAGIARRHERVGCRPGSRQGRALDRADRPTGRRARRHDHGRLRRPAAPAGRGAQGRLHLHEPTSPGTIQLPLELDFMAVSSYGRATKTSGVVRIVKDLDIDLTGRHVLIVEDILDSGLTLSYLRKSLLARGPESLAVCSLLVKERRAAAGSRARLRRVSHRARVRRGLRPRRRRALPQPSGHPRLSSRRARVTSLAVGASFAAGPSMSDTGDAARARGRAPRTSTGSGSAGPSASCWPPSARTPTATASCARRRGWPRCTRSCSTRPAKTRRGS